METKTETQHRHDTDRRYNIVADKSKSLYINRVTVSDSGRYFCNNEAAVELTVIPSGTIRRDAPERTSITLKCSHDDGGSLVPAWSRNNGEIQQPGRFYVSPADKTLTIRDVQPDDSGLYYCDGKPAVYLNVIKGTLNLGLVVGIVVPVILLVLIIVYFILRQRLKKQGSGEKYSVYDEIQDICMTPPTNGVDGFAGDSYCMADLPGRSNQTVDPMNCSIPDVQPRENTENLYSVITDTSVGGNNKDGADYFREILPAFFVHQKMSIRRLRRIVNHLNRADGHVRHNLSDLHVQINSWVASATPEQIRQLPDILMKAGANGAAERLQNKLQRIDSNLQTLGNEVELQNPGTASTSRSGTNRSDAVLKTSVRLKCSSHVAGSDAPTWIRQSGGK
ncbi:hypothetical protein L3Q82_015355 [Scortum barcoo]|uniref:Uncharacterized protein n=1 Tax=Scortum barcoo TaxID=214431 RepID=A0ACB8VU32_9TELE|nr:hypothetical protein L3Q82_015355 [Scortum barcoo]